MNRIRTALISALAASCVIVGVGSASADPDAVTTAKAELDRIQQESSQLDQQIIEAHARAEDGKVTLANLSADLKAQETKVAELAAQLGDSAVIQMEASSFSLTAQLFTSSDSDSFLRGLGAMQVEVDRSNAGVQQLQLDQAKLTTLRDNSKTTQDQLAADEAAKVSLAAEYDAKEAEAQKVYDRLSEEEQQRLAALEAQTLRQAEERQSQLVTSQASRDRNTVTSSGDATTTQDAAAAEVSTSGSGRAQDAVSYALSKVGSRYVWGTSGENTFDCSGLTSWAYRQVGVSLSRSSKAQWSSAGYKVSKSDLQPGDLVFYYSPVSHVGLYIGDGKIVDAANPRSGVRVTSLNSMPFTGARRVVG